MTGGWAGEGAGSFLEPAWQVVDEATDLVPVPEGASECQGRTEAGKQLRNTMPTRLQEHGGPGHRPLPLAVSSVGALCHLCALGLPKPQACIACSVTACWALLPPLGLRHQERYPSRSCPASLHILKTDCHSHWFSGGLSILIVAVADVSRGPLPSEPVIKGRAAAPGQNSFAGRGESIVLMPGEDSKGRGQLPL